MNMHAAWKTTLIIIVANGVVLINRRSSRRRILNEGELVNALRSLAEVDLIEFSGMTFRDQASDSSVAEIFLLL